MPTALYTHKACLLHENGPGHPESPDRLQSILTELEKPDYAALLRREPHAAELSAVTRVHDRTYIDRLFARMPHKGYAALDPDTSLSPYSGQAALCAAGAVIAAVDDVMAGHVENAFCAVRPPGHHAEYASAMGFCLFNNIAIGAAHALTTHALKRVAIIDFDVHHGNGTQDWAATQPGVLFVSSHQLPLWPGSGRSDERGPHRNILNIPLPPGADGAYFRHAMRTQALPEIDRYAPEFLFISAGFDAHRADPLAQLQFSEEDFGWITVELKRLAQKHCNGRIVSSLEGGYDLNALAKSAAAHIKALQEA